MRILFVSHSSLLYGAEITLHDLVRGIKAAGAAEPVVVVPSPGPLVRKVTDLGVPVRMMPYTLWASGLTSFRGRLRELARNGLAVFRFRRLLNRIRPDVVVTNTCTVPSAAIAAHTKGLPHLWYVHEYADPAYKVSFHWGRGITLRLIDRLSDRVLVPSAGLEQYLSRWIRSDRLRLVSPPIDVPSTAASLNPRRDSISFRLIVLGHKVEGKGQEDAVRAIAVLRGRGLPVTLTLVGSEDRKYGVLLRRITKDLAVEDSVVFVEHVENPYELLQDADAVVVCSRRETTGRVVVEAMKLGRPVIGARAGGTKELIRDGWNGLLYAPGDPGDLADRIEMLSRDSDMQTQLATNGRVWAKEAFATENSVKELMTVVWEVLNERERRRPESSIDIRPC